MFNLLYNKGNNKGQALVLAVIVIPVLLAFIFYALGIGDIIRTKIHLQNVADSAAVSAATWQARALNILVAMNNGIEMCYIAIAVMLPALMFALAFGAGPMAAFLLKAIDKCWKTAIEISKIQGNFANLPWSVIALGEAMHIISVNKTTGIAVPFPSMMGMITNNHARGLYAHRATLQELMKPPKKKEDKDVIGKNMKTINVPNKYDMSVKKVNWHQKWKQRATFYPETGEYNLPWKEAKKVGKFYNPQGVEEEDKTGYPDYPDSFKTYTYCPDDYDSDEIISWRPEKRLVSYEWPARDPPLKNWYIVIPEIGDDVVVTWPEEWNHLEEGFRWGFSKHDSFWCYKWEPVFKDDLYSILDTLRELLSEYSTIDPENIPLPWVRDEEIERDEACIVLAYSSQEDKFPWKHISNILDIKPPVVYSVAQARVFRRTLKRRGNIRIKKVSNETRDMILTLPPYDAALEKANLWGQVWNSDKKGSGWDTIVDNILDAINKGNEFICLDH